MNVNRVLVKMEEHVITIQEDIHATVRMVTLDRAVNKVLFILFIEYHNNGFKLQKNKKKHIKTRRNKCSRT